MHGLVSILPAPCCQQVEALWKEMEEEHGLQGIRVTPYPHFSWQIAAEYDPKKLEAAIHKLAAHTPPIVAHTTGLGLFSGPRPVIFIPVVKDAALLRLHAAIWDAAQPASQNLSYYYNPTYWMPHISLAYEDISPENIGPLMQKLAFRLFNWEFQVDNITLIYEPEGQVGMLHFQIPLAKS